ncbi:MAG: type I restriction endonuclease, partial [Ignavibacteria bacterium CHB3]|nr:type I restriction endonuclease [Ignavibacteria bacterium CHB3]
IKVGTKPKKLIYTISEEILQSFSNLILIDKYDVYQHLMTYWTDTMQDDVYIIANDDWKADFYYDTEKKEYVCDLVPKELMIDRYFLKEKEMIEQLEIDRDNVSAQMEEMAEEHSGEDGLLEEVKTDSGKITKTLIKKRLKEISDAVKQYKKVAEPKISYSEDDKEEVEVLNKYLELIEKESDIKKQIKEVEVELLEKLKKKYAELTEVEVKNLVIDDKWLTKIYNDVKSELDRISQQLTNRIKELAERYNKTLPNLDENVKSLESKVNLHLKKMGFEWK